MIRGSGLPFRGSKVTLLVITAPTPESLGERVWVEMGCPTIIEAGSRVDVMCGVEMS